MDSLRWGPLPIRLGLGTVMAVHGFGKLNVGPLANGASVPGVAGFFASLGIPEPFVFAWLVTVVETVGGLFVLLGLFTRYAALLISVDMVTATLLVHLPRGFAISDGGIEFTALLALCAVSLVLMGPGRLALEPVLFGRELIPRRSAKQRDAIEPPA